MNTLCQCPIPACNIWSPDCDGTCSYCGKLIDLSGGAQ